ncbi:hypothetical protein CLIB1444_02S01486 [[Candida] jaroonii]|uniref:Uncharacterized protein n=1 Tax=[Candida] jaroonii TaxID=467808 RepID=A0ACA9Y2G7_9ASCO|nr:hypothetical protein CLIB1444_02S01486 [[Candida] jaroonii]
MKDVRCPICLKLETLDRHDLICSDCSKDRLEIIRNSCIDNDKTNYDQRREINEIFDVISKIKNNDIDIRQHYETRGIDTSYSSIKVLALQLLKLELINSHIKIKNIERSTESLQQKVISLNEKIVNCEEDSSKWNSQLKNMNKRMVEEYQKNMKDVSGEMYVIKHEKIIRISKQSIQIQYNNFKIFKELVFTDKSSLAKSHLLFFNQPIIKISDFFHFNTKLFQLNQFIENLIRLQLKLVDMFNFKLPYMEELKGYLPDSEFFNLVQQKESFMINDGKIDVDDEREEVIPMDINEVDNERVVKLGNEIKLPLSSKTINSQLRRASIIRRNSASPSPQTPNGSPIKKQNSPKPNFDAPLTTSISPRTIPKNSPPHASPEKPTLKRSITGKKVVIVPHKILTKPFTKLSSKEYLKFLSILVKIIINFQTIFSHTIDIIPKTNNLIFDTLNQLRGNDDKYSDYSFDKILWKIYSLNVYFDYKLSIIDLKSPDTSTSSITSSPNLSYDDGIDTIDKIDLKKKPSLQSSKLHKLYSNLFKESMTKKDQEIYGNFSGKLSRKPSSIIPPSPNNLQVAEENNTVDLKVMTRDIHDIMVNAKDRFDLNSVFKNPKLTSDTLQMMAQSKVQLEDWDVISKMY